MAWKEHWIFGRPIYSGQSYTQRHHTYIVMTASISNCSASHYLPIDRSYCEKNFFDWLHHPRTDCVKTYYYAPHLCSSLYCQIIETNVTYSDFDSNNIDTHVGFYHQFNLCILLMIWNHNFHYFFIIILNCIRQSLKYHFFVDSNVIPWIICDELNIRWI